MMSDDTYAPDDMDYADAPSATANALALQPSRLPMSRAIADEFGIDSPTWRVLVEQTFPAAKTVEAVLMALSYCRARKLDIFKKPVHIVPMYSSAKKAYVETVWPGISEIRTTAARTGEYAGIDAVEFGPMVERPFTGKIDVWENRSKTKKEVTKTVKFPEWARVTVYRIVKGQRFAFHAQVFWEETYAKMGRTEIPNEMWEKRARGQLDKCVEAAALRKAFPEEVGNMYAAEEMEGRTIDVTPEPAKVEPPMPPEPPEPPAEAAGDFNADDSTVFDAAAYLAEITETLGRAKTPDEVETFFDEMDVPSHLSGDETSLTQAFNIKAERIKALLPKATRDAQRNMGTP